MTQFDSNPTPDLDRGPAAPVDAWQGRAVVAVFDDRAEAESAVDALERAGFSKDQIGYVVRGGDAGAGGMLGGEVAVDGHEVAADMLTGGMIGGVLATAVAVLLPPIGPIVAAGLLASFFGGTLAGMAVGGLVGALQDLGVNEHEARVYEEDFKLGKAIVAVKAGARGAEVADILSRFGGANIHIENPGALPGDDYLHQA